MPVDPRKRQKKLERRKAKQKAERREVARSQSRGLASRLEEASTAPILHCCVTATTWRVGVGNVLVSRQLPIGQVAFAVFLVDVYCLGVKNAMMNILPRVHYDRQVYGKLARQSSWTPIKPECAHKLVEGAVRYALDLGLPPHADYRTARLIFGDIAAEACTEEYVFGKDGKPFFIAGPHDNSAKCQQILAALQHHCGPDGYHYLIPVGGPPPI